MATKRPTPANLLRKVFPPMLATLTDTPPAGDAWAYELKYDGFRAVCAIVGGDIAMWSRNELDLAPRFPAVAAALSNVKVPEVVIDGEIVVLDEQGAPRFQLLQQGDRREILIVFDILWLDGEDLRKRTYDERRAILEKTLKRTPAAIKVAEKISTTGAEALERAKKSGWEGIIAKRRSSIYEPRRSKEWLKIKAINEQELIVVGWNPSTHSSKEVGSLHLAVMGDDGALHYAGKVGTGFSAKQRVWWKDELSKDVVPKTMVKDAPRVKVATWVKPRFVVQVAFTEWTADNRLRHPAFLGIRDDKKVGEVVRERPSAVGGRESEMKTKASKAAPSPKKSPSKKSAQSRSHTQPPTPHARVNLSNPDRVLYPRDKIT